MRPRAMLAAEGFPRRRDSATVIPAQPREAAGRPQGATTDGRSNDARGDCELRPARGQAETIEPMQPEDIADALACIVTRDSL